MLVPCSLVGTIIGGVVCKYRKLGVKENLRFMLISHVIVLFTMFVFLIHCDASPFFGENTQRFVHTIHTYAGLE